MVEGPFGNFEFNRVHKLDTILLKGIREGRLMLQEKSEIVEEMNQKDRIREINNSSTFMGDVEGITIFVTSVSDEIPPELTVEYKKVLESRGFEDILLGKGDPEETFEDIKDVVEFRRG